MPAHGPRHRRLLSALLMATAVAAVGGILASLAHLAWWLELFSHFRAQYALLLAVCAAGFLGLRRPLQAIVALVLAAANALPLLHYLGPPRAEAAHAEEQTAVLLNVWYRNDHHERVLGYLEQARPDLAVFLEVTPAWADALHRLSGLLPYQAQAGEVLVASRLPLGDLRIAPLGRGGALAVVFDFDTAQGPVTVIGAHANWPLGADIAASRDRELDQLARVAREVAPPVLLLGDFNVTAYSPVFAGLLAQSGLVDCSAGRGLHATWPALFPPLYLQIDHCLADPQLYIGSVSTGPWVGSDHFPLEARFAVPAAHSGQAVTASRRPRTYRR